MDISQKEKNLQKVQNFLHFLGIMVKVKSE